MKRQTKNAKKNTIALPLPAKLAGELKQAAEKTGMSESEIINQCWRSRATQRTLQPQTYERIMALATDEWRGWSFEKVLDHMLEIQERHNEEHREWDRLR